MINTYITILYKAIRFKKVDVFHVLKTLLLLIFFLNDGIKIFK